jgi:chromodomain-containing protein
MLKKTPHELITGMQLSVNVDLIPDHVPATQERLQTLQKTRAELQEHLDRLQKAKDDKRPPQLTVGQRVWLEGRNLHVRGPAKLLPKRYGPFLITQKIGSVAYRLQLPSSIKVHDVFHINLLTLYKEIEEYGQAYTRPPLITVQSEEEYEVESILQARRKAPGDSLEYKVHWKGYPSADDSWVPHEDLHSPDLLKEFYAQGGEVQTVKRRKERLRKIILSCLPPTTAPTTPLSVAKPYSPLPTKTLSDRYNEQRYTPQTSYELSRCSTLETKPTIATKNGKDAGNSSVSLYRYSAMTAKPATRLRTSSTLLPGRSAVMYSSPGRTIKPRKPQGERSFMESCKSLETTPTSTLSATPVSLPAVHPWLTSINCSLSETLRYLCKNSTFFGHCEPPHHMSHTRGRHLRISTTAHAHPPPKLSRSSGLYPETTGIDMSKGCLHSMTTLSQDWEGG